MKLLVLETGQRQTVILTDYICEHDHAAVAPYDLGVSVDSAELTVAGRQSLSGQIRTTCPVCGRVHAALRHYCEFEFMNSTCPKCHGPWRATVTSLKRSSTTPASFTDVAFGFEVELSCPKCEGGVRRLVKWIAGALDTIRRVKIGMDEIEVERGTKDDA